MTTIHAQAERKRQDRSVCRAEKRLCRARMLRVRGLIHPTSAVCATTDTARGEKRLPSEQNQAILKSSGRPLGKCRLKAIEARLPGGPHPPQHTAGLIQTVIQGSCMQWLVEPEGELAAFMTKRTHMLLSILYPDHVFG